VTGDELDRHAFKTPTLRNVGLTYPYFSNGNVAELDDAIVVMGQELEELVAFMHALTGEIPAFPVPALP
jgi:cytochrome c peroxidase